MSQSQNLQMAGISFLYLSLVLLLLGSSEWYAVSGHSSAHVPLDHDPSQGLGQPQDLERPTGLLVGRDNGQTACDDYRSLTALEISDLAYPSGFTDVVLPWENQGVRVGSSEYLTTGIHRIMKRNVSGLGSYTLEDIINTMRDNGCLMFLFGGSVRDQFLGAESAGVNLDSNCDAETLYEICVTNWGSENCNNEDLVIQIGNPVIPDGEDIDIASFFFGPKTNLEYTTNSMAYSPDLNILIDFGFSGVSDTCDRKIRIPVDQLLWKNWTTSTKAFRFWKLRVKDYRAVDEKTLKFIVAEAENGIQSNSASFQEFFCRKALPGSWDEVKQTCNLQCNDEISTKKAEYYAVFEEDFGDEVWSMTVKPLLDKLNICTSNSVSSSATGFHDTYIRYLLNQIFHVLMTSPKMLKT